MSDIINDSLPEQLPFDARRQDAVLGWLLTKDQFFKQCKDRLQGKWFIDPWSGKLYDARVHFFNKYKRCPTEQELLSCEDFMSEAQGARTRLQAKHVEAVTLTKLYGLDTLSPQLNEWFHARVFQDGVQRAADLYNKGKPSEAYQLMESRLKYIKTTDFIEQKAYDFSNFHNTIARRAVEIKGAISFGISSVDRLILPMGEGKTSLVPGDTTLILAPTNIGKTTSKITIAAFNVRNCKPVMLLTHEGVDDDIAEKVLMSMLNINKAQLYDVAQNVHHPLYQGYLTSVQYLGRYFTYIPMNRPGLSVEEVIATIQCAQEEYKSRWGEGYKLLIDDYPAKLGSQNTQFGIFQKRNIDEYVYNQFVQVALEEKFHALLSQQINRTGAKINRGQKGFEERLLTAEDANESYGPSQIATNVITENRSPLDELLNFITYYICKSRSNAKGWAVVCKSKYENCISHSDSLGCTYYLGNLPLGDLIESQFVANMNKEIPRGALSRK